MLACGNLSLVCCQALRMSEHVLHVHIGWILGRNLGTISGLSWGRLSIGFGEGIWVC